MPELPEVESFRRYLVRKTKGKTVAGVHVPEPRILQGTTASGLGQVITGKRFGRTVRRGKQLAVRAGSNGGWITLHFGMTGNLKLTKKGEDLPRFACVVFEFKDGSALSYTSSRLLGRVGTTDNPDAFFEGKGLGPDALTLDEDYFLDQADRRKGNLKGFLLNQSVMAGVGNLYADEALYQAGISPLRGTASLSGKERKALYRNLMSVLEEAVKADADFEKYPARFITPKRGKGARCLRCRKELARKTVAGRTTYYCPGCQR